MVARQSQTKAVLQRFLAERNQYPERAAEIDAAVHTTFNQKVAILVLDMCGFSRLTSKYGIVHFLAMIHQMEQAARPAVTDNGGTVIRQEADNLFAIFDAPAPALEASLDIFRAFDAMNTVVSDERGIHGSIGIGFGDTLVIENHDLFGNEMNYACRLGEDLAGRNEILLTPIAHAALPQGMYSFSPETYPLARGPLPCFKYLKKLTAE